MGVYVCVLVYRSCFRQSTFPLFGIAVTLRPTDQYYGVQIENICIELRSNNDCISGRTKIAVRWKPGGGQPFPIELHFRLIRACRRRHAGVIWNFFKVAPVMRVGVRSMFVSFFNVFLLKLNTILLSILFFSFTLRFVHVDWSFPSLRSIQSL